MHKNITLNLHQTLAHEIKSAKKKMFQNHRGGMSAREAADKFCIDMANRFERVLPPRDHVVATLPNGEEVELYGDAANLDLPQKQSRVNAEVSTILNLFESETPDFISCAVVDAIETACAHFRIDPPTYDDDPLYGNDQTGTILTKLFAQTRLYSLPNARPARAQEAKDQERRRIATATVELLQSEFTPDDLRDKIEEFAASASSGNISEFWHLPGSEAAMEHLLRFVEHKEAATE